MSPRTLRYYDEIGLLKPAGTTESGYRLYGDAQVDMLQQILFYRELGMPLDSIKAIVTAPVLRPGGRPAPAPRELLSGARSSACSSPTSTRPSPPSKGGTMSDKKVRKPSASSSRRTSKWKRSMTLGRRRREIQRPRHVHDARQYDNPPAWPPRCSQRDAAFATSDPAGDLAQKAADLHRQWLSIW